MRRKPVRRPGVALTLRRRPRLRRGLVAAVAVLCGAAVTTTVQGADDARRSWGRRAQVLVATEDLDAGDQLGPANTRLAVQPAPVVPPGALTSLPDDGRLDQPVYEGEVLRR